MMYCMIMLQVGIIFAITSLPKQKLKERKRKQSTDTSSERRSKRKLSETDSALCIFCGKVSSEKLHEYSTRNAEISLTAMTNDMQDNALLAKISGGDLVVIEAKYHFFCLSEYRNRHGSYLRKKSKEVDTDYERVKARAFVEVVSYVEAAIEDELHMFKVKDLCCLYQKRLNEFAVMLKTIKANLRNPFLIILRALAYKNSQMERVKYLSFLKALNHC